MSAPLSKELRATHSVRSMPIRIDDEVKIMSGSHKGKHGRVTEVHRRKWVVYVEKVQRDKSNGQVAKIGIHPSKVQITALKLDKDRTVLLEKKAASRAIVRPALQPKRMETA